jgi:hypothetical protein
MPRWVAVHLAGRYGSVDAELVTEIRPADAQNLTHHGTILTLRDGTDLQVDESVVVMRVLLGRPA